MICVSSMTPKLHVGSCEHFPEPQAKVDIMVKRLKKDTNLKLPDRERCILATALVDLEVNFGIDGFAELLVIQVDSRMRSVFS